MNILKYMKFHFKCLSRKGFYWLYIGYIYILSPFIDPKNIWISQYDDYVDRTADLQLIICFGLIFVISLIIYERYFHIYEDFFCIYVQKPGTYFATMALAGILVNIVPFIVGQGAFFVLNALITGFAPWRLLMGNILVVIMEITALMLFGMGLYILFKKTILAIFIFIIMTFISALISSPYISIPLIASVTKNRTTGVYYVFPMALWVGRGLLISIFLIFFGIVVKRFIRKYNTN